MPDQNMLAQLLDRLTGRGGQLPTPRPVQPVGPQPLPTPQPGPSVVPPGEQRTLPGMTECQKLERLKSALMQRAAAGDPSAWAQIEQIENQLMQRCGNRGQYARSGGMPAPAGGF